MASCWRSWGAGELRAARPGNSLEGKGCSASLPACSHPGLLLQPPCQPLPTVPTADPLPFCGSWGGSQGPAPLSQPTHLLPRGPVSAPGSCQPLSQLQHPGPSRSQPAVWCGSRCPCALPAALGRASSFQLSPVRTLPQNPIALVGGRRCLLLLFPFPHPHHEAGPARREAWERPGWVYPERSSPRRRPADRRQLHRALTRGTDPLRPQKLLFHFPRGRPVSTALPPSWPRLAGQPPRHRGTKHRGQGRAAPRASLARSILSCRPGARAHPASGHLRHRRCCPQQCHHPPQRHRAPVPLQRCWGHLHATPSTATTPPSHPDGAGGVATPSPALSLALWPSAAGARSSLPPPPPRYLRVSDRGVPTVPPCVPTTRPGVSPRPYPGEVSSATVSIAPLKRRVSHSFTSRSRICRGTDTASAGTWPAPWRHPPSPASLPPSPARVRSPGEGTSCFHGGQATQKTPWGPGTAAIGHPGSAGVTFPVRTVPG